VAAELLVDSCICPVLDVVVLGIVELLDCVELVEVVSLLLDPVLLADGFVELLLEVLELDILEDSVVELASADSSVVVDVSGGVVSDVLVSVLASGASGSKRGASLTPVSPSSISGACTLSSTEGTTLS
jgi:hypothetical protein